MNKLHFVLKFKYDVNVEVICSKHPDELNKEARKQAKEILDTLLFEYDTVSTEVTGCFFGENFIGHIFAVESIYEEYKDGEFEEEIRDIKTAKRVFNLNVEGRKYPPILVTFEILDVFDAEGVLINLD